jgi:hypothetical protein
MELMGEMEQQEQKDLEVQPVPKVILEMKVQQDHVA